MIPKKYGLVFWGFAALFYVTRYLCAAMICSGFSGTSSENFNAAYSNVGLELSVLSFVCFSLGAGILMQDWVGKFMDNYVNDLPPDTKSAP